MFFYTRKERVGMIFRACVGLCVISVAGVLGLYDTSARAEVQLLGKEGWRVTLDGSVNGFGVYSTRGVVENPGGHTLAGGPVANGDTFRVASGLLPAVFAFNVHAPETADGLNMRARLGLYPHIHNYNREKNKLGENNIGSTLDLREVFFAVQSESYGELIVGKTLSLFLGKNILTDMTLFGVGAYGPENTLSGSTSLGRIGYGYVYPNFNAGVRYNSRDYDGLRFSVGVYDPSKIRGNYYGTGGVIDAANTPEPRLEAEVSYSDVALGGFSVDSWMSGMYQRASFANAAACETIVLATHSDHGCDAPISWGIGAGVQGNRDGLTLTGSGYWGRGLGTLLMLDTNALDSYGDPIKHYGYIAQATYDFGQGSGAGISFGATFASASAQDNFAMYDATTEIDVQIRKHQLFDLMFWHNVSDNIRLVAEYGNAEVVWFNKANVESNIFSIGGFYFF